MFPESVHTISQLLTEMHGCVKNIEFFSLDTHWRGICLQSVHTMHQLLTELHSSESNTGFMVVENTDAGSTYVQSRCTQSINC